MPPALPVDSPHENIVQHSARHRARYTHHSLQPSQSFGALACRYVCLHVDRSAFKDGTSSRERMRSAIWGGSPNSQSLCWICRQSSTSPPRLTLPGCLPAAGRGAFFSRRPSVLESETCRHHEGASISLTGPRTPRHGPCNCMQAVCTGVVRTWRKVAESRTPPRP